MRKYAWEKAAKETTIQYDKEGRVKKKIIREVKSKKQYSVADRILIIIDSLKGKDIYRENLEKMLSIEGIPSPSDTIEKLKNEGLLFEPTYGVIHIV